MKIKYYVRLYLCIGVIASLALFIDATWAKESVLNGAPRAVELSGVGAGIGEDTITDLNNHGYMMLNQGNATAAEQAFKQALDQISLRGHTSPTTLLAALNGIGLCNFQERKFAEAEKAYLEAKKLIDANPINDAHIRAMVSNNLGQAYKSQSKLELAEACYEEAIKTEQTLPNPDRHFLASAKCNLGVLYFQQKRYTDAEPIFTQGMAVLHDSVGESDPAYRSYIPYYKAVLEANGNASASPGL